MRVIHIIPAAFNYFDDIRDAAFSLMEAEEKLGLEVEAFTLQYGRSNERLASEVARVAPTRKFQGIANAGEIIDALSSFDLIHLHCPFLGLAGKIIHFKKTHPEIPLVLTYHRPVPIPDLFSVYISWYTIWYLPKLLRVADALAVPPVTPKLARLEPPRFELQVNGAISFSDASDYFTIYHQLVS